MVVEIVLRRRDDDALWRASVEAFKVVIECEDFDVCIDNAVAAVYAAAAKMLRPPRSMSFRTRRKNW